MYQFTQLGNETNQKITMRLNDNSRIVFIFKYKPNQLGWFFDFEYNGTSYRNIRLTTSYNILRAYKSWLPFGLRCDTPDMEEPTAQNDFINNYATVYLLTQEDIAAIESEYYQKVS